MINSEGTAAGTYLHGIFDHGRFLRGFLKPLMEKYHLGGCRYNPMPGAAVQQQNRTLQKYANKEAQYDKLAELVRKSMDIEKIYEMMGGKPDV